MVCTQFPWAPPVLTLDLVKTLRGTYLMHCERGRPIWKPPSGIGAVVLSDSLSLGRTDNDATTQSVVVSLRRRRGG